MPFLTPFLLTGLGALAIPVLIHLIQRERTRVVLFPSLMFVRKIPYQSVRRRRIRHWLLLAMRAAALTLIVLAFARPFLRQNALAAAAIGGAREVVVLLDQSSSMGYGDHWQRAQDAARTAIRNLGSDDRGTLVLFARNAEENMRATSDRGRLEGAVSAARVGSGATRYGPALKLAESILSRSSMKRREAVLISDFQKNGWTGSDDAHFPEGMTLRTVSVASAGTANVSVPSVSFARSSFSGHERVAITAGITNRGDATMSAVPVTLTIDGRDVQTERATVAAHASASVTFAAVTLADVPLRGTVRAGTDPLPADNAFHFVVAPSAPLSVLVIDNAERAASSLFLSRALGIGTTPTFQMDVIPGSRLSSAAVERRAVVVLNDAPLSADGVALLKRYVEAGGGLLVVAGGRTSWPTTDTTLFPGTLGAPVDRMTGRAGTLGYLDYSHPVFEVFKAPRSGDFSSAHVFQYRTLTPATEGTRVLARFDDGGVAAAERTVGQGRVIAWTSTLDDSWTDLPVKPVFLPLVHQLVRYLGRYEQPASWYTVGQVLDLTTASAARAGAAAAMRGGRAIVTPSGRRITQNAGGPGLLELDEQGLYEVRPASGSGRTETIAVNLDPAEADLTPLDPSELVAAVTGRAGSTTAPEPAAEMSREDAEKRQGVWWYLLVAGLLLLAAETTISNRLSQRERFL